MARGRPYCTLVAGSHPSQDFLSGNPARNLASVLKRDSTNNCKQCSAEDHINSRFGKIVRLQIYLISTNSEGQWARQGGGEGERD